MLHSTFVSSEAAEETSTRTSRHNAMQVIPRASYSFGDAELLPGQCITIESKPVSRVIDVHQSAVAPDSLPGSALPRPMAVMPTGEMRGLGEPLATVPAAFRHGVAVSRKNILGNKEVRRVGNSLVPMAPMMRDYDRNPIVRDRDYLNRSGGTAVMPNYGLAPDDKLRQKLIRPTEPGVMVERRSQIVVERPGQTTDVRDRYETKTISRSTTAVNGISPGVFSMGLSLALAGTIFWLTVR